MPDEAKLIQDAAAGSVEAFSELVLLHQGRVRAYLGRYVRDAATADDLAQEVFLAAYRTLNTYSGSSTLGVWLIGIARNRALTFLRDESRRKTRESGRFEAQMVEWRIEQAEAQDEKLSNREITALEACVKTLPEHSSKLVSEYYFKARNLVDIAKELGRKESAVRMNLLRVRHALKDCIENRLLSGGA
ncbi:MAG TPA: sigma-70 family RNA polymerase sigma factor [Planctomycetota bacterium]|nr:sigma-70 family RNA polymerase sigma factor [Planctomycetota bacterium]